MTRLADIPAEYLPSVPPVLRQVLWSRGLHDEKSAEAYLFPRLQNVSLPHGQLKDLEAALELLLEARDKGAKVLIFGDYDVDGATSTALLFRSLQDLGWQADWFIPHRVEDGYGITAKAVERLRSQKPDFSVLISCDCGISSFEGVRALKDWGKKVIITDHHECPTERVPADAILNPKQPDCSYPEKNFAGVGVAFLLVLALRRALDARDYNLRSHLELVAIGTVCDVAELRGSNRIFVKAGLKSLADSSFPGLKAILQMAGAEGRPLRSRDLGFLVGPRLNAVGRIGDPSLGLKTLISPADQALAMAKNLEVYNQKRRQMQEEHLQQALEWVQTELDAKREVNVVFNSSFHLGVVGLVASKLSEKYARPFCVLARLEDEHDLGNYSPGNDAKIWKGSLRAPKGFHLAKILQSLSAEVPDLFLSFGGHAQAAGVAIREQNLELFQRMFSLHLKAGEASAVEVECDAVLEDASRLAEVLDWMEPLGQGNEAPRLNVKGYQVKRVQIMKKEHLKLHGHWQGASWPILQFKSPWVNIFASSLGGRLDFVGELSENNWQGQKTLEFVLKDVLDWKALGRSNGIERKANEISHRQGL